MKPQPERGPDLVQVPAGPVVQVTWEKVSTGLDRQTEGPPVLVTTGSAQGADAGHPCCA